MHGWCNCKGCIEEWAARNAYHIEDDYEAPHKKVSKKKPPRKAKGCPQNNGSAHIYVWTAHVRPRVRHYYDGREWKWVHSKTEFWTTYKKVCVGCLKPDRRSRWNASPQPEQIYQTYKSIW